MPSFPETIPELFEWRAARQPTRHWLRFESDSYSFGDVARQIDRFAVGLQSRGVVPGDRVAVLTGNRPETIFCWFAANRLGAIFAPYNPALKLPELVRQTALVTPRVLVVTDETKSLGASTGVPLVSLDELSRSGAGAPRATVGAGDVAVLLATSGTTGAPKAVAQTHRTYMLAAEALPSWLGLGPTDRLLTSLPLFHINAQAYSVLGSLGADAELALLPSFHASRFWQDAKRLGATELNAVGAMLHILMKREPSDADRDHSVRLCYAALALPERLHCAFEQRFGLRLSVGYGLSETPYGTVWPLDEAPRYGSMGRLRQHPRLGEVNRGRVVRDDGQDALDGEPGELWLKNPALFQGYWRAPEETSSVLSEDWLRTGDLVRRDPDGYFTFIARKKDVIRRRGENVAAAEIENVLLAHPSVLEAAAVGAPSELGEDEIVAYVAPQPGVAIDVESLVSFCRDRLADFKVPSRIYVRDELPRTPTQRIAKHLLK